MKFEYITIQQVYKSFKPLGYVDLPDALVRFIHNYNVIGVRWSEPTTISASYFLRLLQNGAAEKVGKNDNGSIEMSNFYQPLLDHGALWKTKDGGVICTAMPYGDKKSIVENFRKMVETFSYPETIRLQFLDDKYRFRSNGNHMILISHNSYTDSNVNDLPEPEWEKIELYKSRLIEVEKAYIRRSSNLYAFGQEVQMDACFKLWFGGISSALHLAVDKGTKKVLFGWFEYEEITRGYFVLLYNIIINYGIPEKIKTDNRNSFSNNKNKVDNTQFGIICNTLGIKLVTTSSAVSKSNVERENGTFKNRLIAELRHENITTIDEANKYLNNIFISKMNKKFSYEINEKTTKMRVNHYTELELNLIISEKYTRIIDNASSIKYNTKYYIPINPTTGEIVYYSHKTKCIFIITYNGEYWCEIENNYYLMLEVENRDTIMKKEKDNSKPIERKKYVPPANHPWRKKLVTKH